MGMPNGNGSSSVSVKSDHGTTPQGFCSQSELREKEILLNSFLVKQKKKILLCSFQS